MYATYPHGLTIQQFAKYFRLDPWHVAGFCTCTDPDEYAMTQGCRCGCGTGGNSWNEATLADVSWAIAEAEADLYAYLGFPPIERWFVGEEVFIEGKPGWWQKGGRPRTVSTSLYIHEFGLRTLSYLGNAPVAVTVPIVGQLDTTAITYAVGAGVQAAQVRFFVPDAYRFGLPLDGFEIQAESVGIVGTTLTATFRNFRLGLPDVNGEREDCLNRNDEDSYITSIDLYVEGLDKCAQGVAIGTPEGGCGGQPCLESETPVCMTHRINGVYQYQALKGCAEGVFSLDNCPTIAPNRLRLNFKAGYPNRNGRLDPLMVAAVCNLAASKLSCDLPSCDCDTCRYDAITELRKVEKVKVDEGASGEIGDRYSILATADQKNNAPFGVHKGALDAWRTIRQYKKL